MQEIYQFLDELQPAILFIAVLLALGICWALDRISD